MEPSTLIAFLARLEKLKCNTRHAWTTDGRQETVAAHSWRLATLALLVRDEIPGVDFDRVIQMCLVHDFGEAVTGDIPSFLKSAQDEDREEDAVARLLADLPDPPRARLSALFAEMGALATPEARVYKALDKMEAVLQHNEGPIDTWLPLEYDLQRTYGTQEAEGFAFLAALRGQMLRDTEAKIARHEG